MIFNRSRRSVSHFKLSLVVLSLPGLPVWRVWTLKSSWYQKLSSGLILLACHSSSISTSSWLITLIFSRTVNWHFPLTLVYNS